ncbi:MAG: hypothetical protein WBC55_02760 [Dehalococcoidia bacterium]
MIFAIGGVPIGGSTTNSTGEASVTYTVPITMAFVMHQSQVSFSCIVRLNDVEEWIVAQLFLEQAHKAFISLTTQDMA